MTRTPTADKRAHTQERSQSVRVTRVRFAPGERRAWVMFAPLVRQYVETLQGRHPWPPTPRALIAQATRPEVSVFIAERDGSAVGFAMAEPREGGTGRAAMWIEHLYCPRDLGAARALVAEIEAVAARRGCEWMAFETAAPDMRRRAALAGFRPVATVYGREVWNGRSVRQQEEAER